MNKSVVAGIVSVVVGVALAYGAGELVVAHAQQPGGPGCPPGLGDKDRCIEVTVTMTGGQPTIQAIPDQTMSAPGAIWWHVKNSPGYSFPNDGIDFANPGAKAAAPANTFTQCGPQPPGNQRFKCVNNHPVADPTHPYGYKVTLSGSPAVAPLDPFVVNN